MQSKKQGKLSALLTNFWRKIKSVYIRLSITWKKSRIYVFLSAFRLLAKVLGITSFVYIWFESSLRAKTVHVKKYFPLSHAQEHLLHRYRWRRRQDVKLLKQLSGSRQQWDSQVREPQGNFILTYISYVFLQCRDIDAVNAICVTEYISIHNWSLFSSQQNL